VTLGTAVEVSCSLYSLFASLVALLVDAAVSGGQQNPSTAEQKSSWMERSKLMAKRIKTILLVTNMGNSK
jgi:hypothetical protein